MTNHKRYCNIKSPKRKRYTKISGNGGKVQWEDEILIMVGNDLNVSNKMTISEKRIAELQNCRIAELQNCRIAGPFPDMIRDENRTVDPNNLAVSGNNLERR